MLKYTKSKYNFRGVYMNNRIIFRQAVCSFIFVSVAGSLLHFVYDWSGQSRLAGYFSAVNESTWEHMKLMFIPMFIFALYLLFRFRKSRPSVFPAYAVAALIAVFLIPVFFYTYTGVLGFNVNFLNLTIFYVCAAIGSTCFYRLAVRTDLSDLNIVLLLIHLTLLLAFIFFTYNPPFLGIFISPV